MVSGVSSLPPLQPPPPLSLLSHPAAIRSRIAAQPRPRAPRPSPRPGERRQCAALPARHHSPCLCPRRAPPGAALPARPRPPCLCPRRAPPGAPRHAPPPALPLSRPSRRPERRQRAQVFPALRRAALGGLEAHRCSPPMDVEFPPLSSWVRTASPGRLAAVALAAAAALRPSWGAGPIAAGGALTTTGTTSVLAAVADVPPVGVAGPEDPPPPIPPSLVVDPHPVVDPSPPPPPVAHQGYTVAALTAARAEHAAGQARLREATLVWEREREAAGAIAAQIAAAEQLLVSPATHDGGSPPLTPWAECTASRPHRPSEPGPAPTPPRCCGMTRLTRSWLSSTFRLGVSKTFASWFLSSWSHSRRPMHAGGTYSSSPFAATLWMTTSSATVGAKTKTPPFARGLCRSRWSNGDKTAGRDTLRTVRHRTKTCDEVIPPCGLVQHGGPRVIRPIVTGPAWSLRVTGLICKGIPVITVCNPALWEYSGDNLGV
jgi:hypothetical protein